MQFIMQSITHTDFIVIISVFGTYRTPLPKLQFLEEPHIVLLFFPVKKLFQVNKHLVTNRHFFNSRKHYRTPGFWKP
jgi:hypothetical protein